MKHQMRVEWSGSGLNQLEVEALAVAVFKDEKADKGLLKELDDLTGGLVRSVIESGEIKGKEGESALLHLSGKGSHFHRLLLVGAGEPGDYAAAQISRMAGAAARLARSKSIKSI